MPKRRQLVFIDDSGDPGFKKGASSSNFVLAAALFMDSGTATRVNDAITKYRHSLGWRDDYEFKFSKIRKDFIVEVLQIITRYDFQIYAVYSNKIDYSNSHNVHLRNKELYNLATKDLLSIMPLDKAIIRIDGKYDKEYRRYMRAFIRQELNIDQRKVADFDALDSKKNNLVQLADLIAGAINRALQSSKTDSDKYIKIIRNKIVVLKNLGNGQG